MSVCIYLGVGEGGRITVIVTFTFTFTVTGTTEGNYCTDGSCCATDIVARSRRH